MERLLYRLSLSETANQFVLKGALLFFVWGMQPHRPTRDLDFPPPRIRAYPRETVIAEKLQAMVVLGIANSRMKDFYDLYVLSRDFAYDGAILTRAIKATFERRTTDIPRETPLALTDEFGRNEVKAVQWKAFIHKSGLDQSIPDLVDVLSQLRDLMLPPLWAASKKTTAPKQWNASGSWAYSLSDGT